MQTEFLEIYFFNFWITFEILLYFLFCFVFFWFFDIFIFWIFRFLDFFVLS